jgi:isochorismate synthase EntC
MDKNLFLQSGCFLAIPGQDEVWCSFGVLTRSKEKEKMQKISFYQNDFFLKNSTPWVCGEHFFEFSMSEFESLFEDELGKKPDVVWNQNGIENYKTQFSSLMHEIEQGRLQKGVPYAVETALCSMDQNKLVYLIKNLIKNNKTAQTYLYGFWDLEKQQICLGATPELLFVQNAQEIKTIAIAGTVASDLSSSDVALSSSDVALSSRGVALSSRGVALSSRGVALSSRGLTAGSTPKINSEHQFVIDGIQSSLQEFGSLDIKETTHLDLGSFSHLKTDIFVHLNQNEFHFEIFLSALHPTAALGTLPKDAGKNWLCSLEKSVEPRGFYGGAFGLSIGLDFSLCVGMIRCLQWTGNQMKITAGGGVIAQSDFSDEWAEICLKFGAIKKSLGLGKIDLIPF